MHVSFLFKSNTATHLADNLIKRLESHGEVVIVIQVSHALLDLTLIVTVAVAAPPCVAVTVAPPQVRCSASSQRACAENGVDKAFKCSEAQGALCSCRYCTAV